ncbi:CapA family protein [Marimonas arenosa]|uniref:CapA family protein n=1 Tax=Marimonas arenosa TaxID=1795305 RepID=A0AAE3WC34_9RHOB|nr:CapA family protein [Marimonas arenosa]MDQ2089894.1 CapA family protein [Marimonas arenosa]
MTGLEAHRQNDTVRLFLGGDVMTGRGIDQILPHPGDPTLHEGYVETAEGYVALAEQRNGPIPRAVPFGYIWGDLLDDLERRDCDLRFVNLETAVTTSDTAAPKGINYRMHPANAPVLSAAGIDAVTLANNHTLDWGIAGLVETLDVVEKLGISVVGAGRTGPDAAAPQMLPLPNGGRVLILAYGARDSGIPGHWGAAPAWPGINLLPDRPDAAVADARARLENRRQAGDVTLVSIHWGGNWGYEMDPEHRRLAHRLIEEAGVDIVHGHSSHHPKAIEIHEGKLVLYGAGDLINDYEGISGRETFRSDLVLGYVAEIAASDGRIQSLELLPYRIRRFRLCRAKPEESEWLHAMLQRECGAFGLHVAQNAAGAFQLTPS